MSKKKGKRNKVSDKEKEFLMQPENVKKFAAAQNGVFSEIVLTIHFMQNITKALEQIEDDTPNNEQLKTILHIQQLDIESWGNYLKRCLTQSKVMREVRNWPELNEYLVGNKLSLKKFLATEIKKQAEALKPQLLWLGSYINDNIRKLREQADKYSMP